MKKIVKILLLSLTLALLLGTVLAIGASAEENTTVVIPEGYTDPTAHPILIYEASTMTFIKSCANYNSLLDYLYNWTGYLSSKYIYVQADLSGNTYYANTGANYGSHIIDLGGHTFTLGTTLVDLQSKNNRAMGLTFKNGDIVVANKYIVKVHSNANGAGKTANIAFENINFKGITSGALVYDANASSTAFTTNVTFKNCTAEVTGAAALFQLGSTANATINVGFHGGQIIYKDASANPTIKNTNALANQTVTFYADDSGEYTKITTPSEMSLDSFVFPTDNDKLELVKISSDDSTVTYQIAIPSATPSIPIPPEYSDPKAHPILVYEASTMNCLTSFTTYNALLDYLWNWTGYLSSKYIYVQADLSGNTYYANTGANYGSHIIDLGGHTFTLNTTLVDLQAKNNKTMGLTFKNGDIVVANKYAVKVHSNANGAGKIANIAFENINFKSITSGALVYDANASASAFTTNVTFKNCTAEVTGTAALFQLGNTANATINVSYLGGQISYTGATVPAAYKNTNSLSNQTVIFGANDEGEKTTVRASASIDVAALSYPTESGNAYLRKTAEEDGIATYTLSTHGFISTYLNLTSDLNMVYRVFLPATSQPTVTFTYGDYSKTIEEYTVDSNGLYLFKLTGITAARIGKEITATLTVNGETVGTSTYSIKAYLDAVKAQNTEDEDLVSLVDALLVYGAAAQAYVGDTDTPVAEIGTLTAIPESAYKMSGDGFAQFGMRLDGAFALRVGIALDTTDGITLEVNKGGDVTTYNLADYTARDGMITISYGGILANELDSEITFTLKNADVTIGTLTVSANAYLYRANATADEKLVTLARAIYAYGRMADAYAK